MPHSHTSINIHYVFSPLGRAYLESIDTRNTLTQYMKGICIKLDVFCLAICVMPNHVHILVQLPPHLSVAEFAQKLKANSSRHLNTLPNRKCRFVWQTGYGAFSCSYSAIETIQNYIANQEDHHRRHNYEDEYKL